MDTVRPLLHRALWALGIGMALLLGGILDVSGHGWFMAHGAILMVGFAPLALSHLHLYGLQSVIRRAPGEPVQFSATPRQLRVLGNLWVAASGATAAGWWIAPVQFGAGALLLVLGMVAVVAAAVMTTRTVFRQLPKSSIVDEQADPLTKGDDACLKHVRIAHIFLPLGVTMVLAGLLVGEVGEASDAWGSRLWLAGIHFLSAYLLLSVYGIGHLLVPRFSGVPAIAAGAIKGELHTTLLGMTGLLIGFLTGMKGFLLGLGPFVFLGFFTYMGVLGANIMRNKSRTAQVTPEFVYIPWTFAGVFWLISGVLLGIFLRVVPDLYADKMASLSFIHVHMNLFGGLAMLLLGWWTRSLPGPDRAPPPFGGAMKGAFYGTNGALVIALLAHLDGGPTSLWFVGATALAVVSLALYVRAMAGFLTPASSGN